jgi:hypothetical protein
MGWNLPPGCTDRDIDEAACGSEERDAREAEREVPEMADILEDMYEIEEYLINRADADHIDGRYRPNEEMRLLRGLKRAIARLECRP